MILTYDERPQGNSTAGPSEKKTKDTNWPYDKGRLRPHRLSHPSQLEAHGTNDKAPELPIGVVVRPVGLCCVVAILVFEIGFPDCVAACNGLTFVNPAHDRVLVVIFSGCSLVATVTDAPLRVRAKIIMSSCSIGLCAPLGDLYNIPHHAQTPHPPSLGLKIAKELGHNRIENVGRVGRRLHWQEFGV